MARSSDLRDHPTFSSSLPGLLQWLKFIEEISYLFYSSGTVVELHNLPLAHKSLKQIL